MSKLGHYVYRQYPDSSWDAICTLCYRTIGGAPEKSSLTFVVAAHVCHTADLNMANHGRAMPKTAPAVEVDLELDSVQTP
jgi:hypothetical protein